jgi:glycosyltransferase involved in cell wall biosynthesis
MVYDLADDLPEMIRNLPQIPALLRTTGRFVGRNMLRRTVESSVKVVGISRALQRAYSIPEEKFEWLPNGVDTRHFRFIENNLRTSLGLEDSFIIGYVGVLREWVDLEPVFAALARVDDATLVIAGAVGNIAHFKRIAESAGVKDRVKFLGTVPYSMVPLYMSTMDVGLIPFKRNAVSNNAVPLKLLEYLACGIPVVSTRLAGVREIAGDDIDYADTPEDYVCKFEAIKSGKRTNMQSATRERIISSYDWDVISLKFEKIIEAAI